MNMKTLNEKVAKTVKSNNATMGNVEELTKVLKQEEKELERLTKRNADEAVIAAQQNVVDSAKAKLEQAQEFEKESNENIGNDFLTFSVVNEETGARAEQQKKIAFVKNNRSVNSKKVDGFIALIAANKYEKAIEALEGGIKIKPDYADFYYSLGLAQTSLADEIIENSEKELSEGEKNAEIVNTEPKKELSDEDKAKVADLKKQAAENLTKYLEMNPNGEDKQTVEELIKEINSYSEESSAKVEE